MPIAGLDLFSISAVAAQSVDESTLVNVTALDSFGNIVNFTNSELKFLTSLPASLSNSTIDLQHGVASHIFTSEVPGACVIAIDRNTYAGAGSTSAQATIAVAVGSLVGFSFKSSVPNSVVGTPLPITVHAVDQYLNQVDDSRTLAISSSGSELDGLGSVILNSGTGQITLGSLLAQEAEVYATDGTLTEVKPLPIVFLAGI